MAKAYKDKDELLSTNWQEKINNASSDEERRMYEQARNDKIAQKEYQDWGGKQTQTHHYQNDDYSAPEVYKPTQTVNPTTSSGRQPTAKEVYESIFYDPYAGRESRPGVARNPVKEVMFRKNMANANKRIAYGDYTYVFDDAGYQVGKIRDGGASATDVLNVDLSGLMQNPNYKAAYDVLQTGDLDTYGNRINDIAGSGPISSYDEAGAPVYNMADANAFNSLMQLTNPRPFKDFYRNKYDSIYGVGAWDDPGHSRLSDDINPAYRQEAMKHGWLPQGPAGSNPIVGGYINAEAGLPPLGWSEGASSGGYPFTPPTGIPSGNGSPAQGGAYGSSGGSYGSSSGVPGSSSSGSIGFSGGSVTDLTDVLKKRYADMMEAELAQLGSDFRSAAKEYGYNDDVIDDLFQGQKNEAAAQSDIQKMYANEMGVAQGLNTGATGQLALGQSMALQGALAGIGKEQAAAQAKNDLAYQQLRDRYDADRSAIRQKYDAMLEEALYNEQIRQDEANQRAYYAEQERIANEQAAQAKADAAAQKAALDDARWLAAHGDFSGLQALGYDTSALEADYARKGRRSSNGGGGNPSGGGDIDLSSILNGGSGVTPEQIRQLQGMRPTLSVDGIWGPASSAAFGGLTADEAWDKYGTAIRYGDIINTAPSASRLLGNQNVLEYVSDVRHSDAKKIDAITEALQNGEITEDGARAMLTVIRGY